MAHARLSPSSADRWFVCPGSIVAAEESGVPDTTSSYAAEGTAAHELLEMALKLGADPMELVDTSEDAETEKAEAVAYAVDYVKGYLAITPEAEFHSEICVPWGAIFGRFDLFGTTDIIIVAPDELIVGDLKYGQGVVVEVHDNLQLLLYLLGLRHLYGPRPQYKMTIIQPRARHVDGPIRSASISEDELRAFASRAREAIARAEGENAPRTAGEHCRWCRAAAVCPTLAEYAIKTAADVFSAVTLYDILDDGAMPEVSEPANLSTEQLARLLDCLPIIEAWDKAVYSEALRRALTGETVPNYKLVRGKSNRTWDNDEAVMAEAVIDYGLPLDTVAPRTVISPAQMEKALIVAKVKPKQRQPLFDSHVRKPLGAPTLAHHSDPRPDYVPTVDFPEEIPNA